MLRRKLTVEQAMRLCDRAGLAVDVMLVGILPAVADNDDTGQSVASEVPDRLGSVASPQLFDTHGDVRPSVAFPWQLTHSASLLPPQCTPDFIATRTVRYGLVRNSVYPDA